MYSREWKEIFFSLWKREGNAFIQFLLDAGLDVNALNESGKTMLSYAAKYGNMEIVEFLTQKGADGNVKNIDGSTPLHKAARYGQPEMVKFFLSSIEFVDIRDENGNTPLHYAAMELYTVTRESYHEIVHCLLNSGANLDAVNKFRDTPLLIAAAHRCKDFVELLIGLGANVECIGSNNKTLLHYCCEFRWAGLLNYLLKGGFNIDLNAKANIAMCCRGYLSTPLTIAASLGHEEIVKLLIEHGADVKLKVWEGGTLLHSVCQSRLLDTVKYLVETGGDVNVKCSLGKTPLFWAVDGRGDSVTLEVMQYLIDNGADINCLDIENASVLHNACNNRSLTEVKVLTKNGCDLNIQGSSTQDTPLHIAVQLSALEIIKHLLEVGADYKLQNSEGDSAFHLLLKSPICLEGIAFFLESGAFFQAKDYIAISENPLLKESILKDLKLCTQAIMNKLNVHKLNEDLLKIYEIPTFSKRLPLVANMEIAIKRNVKLDIQQSVSYDLQSKGYCNVMQVRPINLAILSVRSLIEYYDSITGDLNKANSL